MSKNKKSVRIDQAPRDEEFIISERKDQDVELLNHCFEDIESFISRLQHTIDSLEEAQYHRTKDDSLGGMVRSAPTRDFIRVFQKFKLAFNLLGKLRDSIHDPNAPELVHFLFTPLSLVVEASKDPQRGTPDLAARVVSPLLTLETIGLFNHCLTSKEAELWESLGDAWTMCREDWKGFVSPYDPKFDQWKPSPDWVQHQPSSILGTTEQRPRELSPPSQSPPSGPNNMAQDQRDFLQGLQGRGVPASNIMVAHQSYVGRNQNEMNVWAGDVLELLDASRNWWQLRNSKGEIGYLPYTILQQYGSVDSSTQIQYSNSQPMLPQQTPYQDPSLQPQVYNNQTNLTQQTPYPNPSLQPQVYTNQAVSTQQSPYIYPTVQPQVYSNQAVSTQQTPYMYPTVQPQVYTNQAVSTPQMSYVDPRMQPQVRSIAPQQASYMGQTVQPQIMAIKSVAPQQTPFLDPRTQSQFMNLKTVNISPRQIQAVANPGTLKFKTSTFPKARP